jgi:hypothetical protein
MDNRFLLLAAAVGLTACTNNDTRYEFEGVDHREPTVRHVLIDDLEEFTDSLTDQIDTGAFTPSTEGEVVARLEYFFSTDPASRAGDPMLLTTDPPALQRTYGELANADLISALAPSFRGWSDPAIAAHGGGTDSPANFLRAIFETAEANALARANGVSRRSPGGEELPVEVTESGLDLTELIEEFLLGAVALHEAADDRLDEGLSSDNTVYASGHTALQHAWDEAFGYFGASTHYGELDVADVAAGTIERDEDGDGRIDLTTERLFGAAIIAGRRDDASVAPTDFAGQAFRAFAAGRTIITDANGPLSEAQMTELRAQRDLALGAWEASIAATIVHTINEVLQVMADFDTPAYDHDRFLDHAEEWSEMKAFALSLQYNPRSPLTADAFAMLHQLMGDAPVLPADGVAVADAYRASLRQARAILAATYGFDARNLGDDGGLGGW